MEKVRQQELTYWLKTQSIIAYRWLNVSRILGFINGLLIIVQTWILANILHHTIIENVSSKNLLSSFIVLILMFILRSCIFWLRERVGLHIGQRIRYELRRQVINKLQQAGPAWIKGKPAGSWTTLILEQIDNMHDYYAHYLPQMMLGICIPLMIITVLFLINWASALILLCTAPLIPLFIIMIGTKAEEANQRNFIALERLGGYFLDRLRGIETLRLFNQGNKEIENIRRVSQDFRQKTMEVIYLAFLSSSILEFFSSLSIALVAVYFGFSYLGKLNFGYYNHKVTLFDGFLALILSPEFFQPLRDLGALYHAKAQAIAAAENLKTFLDTTLSHPQQGKIILNECSSIEIEAKNLLILSPDNKILAGPLNFKLIKNQRVALVGTSGSGKSSLLNVLSGFLPYRGSLLVNNVELSELNLESWQKMFSWIGQNPQLPFVTIRDNILLANPGATREELNNVLERAWVNEFLLILPRGIDSIIGHQGSDLSVGQVQRISIARALLKSCKLLLLDEPTASLDIHSERKVMDVIDKTSHLQTTLMITHQFNKITGWDQIWVMENGKIIEKGNYMALHEMQGAFFKLLTSRYKEI